MANDVQVRFGANISDLTDGIEGVRSAINSLKTDLLAIAGIDLSVRGIESFITGMAALGSQTETTAAILGVSNQQVGELSGIARASGTTIDALALGFDRMTLNIQKSTKDGFNPAAAALKLLGLNARDLIGLPADAYFERLADAVERFNPSLNLTNALTQLGGRSLTAMLPVLLQGGEHFRTFETAVDAASEGLARAVPGMADTHEKLVILETAAESFGARVFTAFKPAIDAAITLITEWLERLDSGKINAFASSLTDVLGDAAVYIAGLFFGAGTTVDEFNAKLDAVLGRMKAIAVGTAGGAALGGVFGGVPGAIGGGILGGLTGDAVGYWTQLYDQIHNGRLRVEDETNKSAQTVADHIRAMQATIKNALAAGLGQGAGKGTGGQDAGALSLGGKDQLNAELAGYAARIAGAQSFYSQEVELINSAAKTFGYTEEQKTDMLRAAVAARLTVQLAEIDEELKLPGLTVAARQKAEDEKTKIVQRANADIQKINDQATQQYVKDWTNVLTPVVSAFNSQLRGLLAGTTTWAQAMKKIVGDLIIQLIEYFERLAVEKAAAGIVSATGGGSPQSLVGELLGGGSSAVTSANTTALGALTSQILTLNGLLGAHTAATAADTTATTASTAATGASTVATGASTVATTSSFGATILNTAAIIPNTIATVANTVATALKGILPSFDVGSWSVPADTVAMVHQGEMIVPAADAPGIRGLLTGGAASGVYSAGGSGAGGPQFHFNGPVYGTQAWINQVLPQLAKALANYRTLAPSVQ